MNATCASTLAIVAKSGADVAAAGAATAITTNTECSADTSVDDGYRPARTKLVPFHKQHAERSHTARVNKSIRGTTSLRHGCVSV